MTVTKSSSHNVHKQFMKAIERLKAAGGTALQAAIKWTVRIVQKRCYLKCSQKTVMTRRTKTCLRIVKNMILLTFPWQ